MHADPEFDPLLHRNIDTALGHRALDSHRATDSLYGAGVFYENSVSGRLDDATMISRDAGIDDLTPNGLDLAKRSALVPAHQPAVAGHVCDQDRCKPALRVHLMHSRSPLSTRQGAIPRGAA